MSGLKRGAKVPRNAILLGEMVSKADLLEAALALAGLCSDADSADDQEAALVRLHEELQAQRMARGAKSLPDLSASIAKWDRRAAEHAARKTPDGEAEMRSAHAVARRVSP